MLRSAVVCAPTCFALMATVIAPPSMAQEPARPNKLHRDYDLVYVRMPRRGDAEHMRWPEVFHPGTLEPGSDLMLLRPDGMEEVLVRAGHGAVTDPAITFDGQSVLYSYVADARLAGANPQRGNLPRSGADIYRLHLPTRRIERLTHQEFAPNLGAGYWDENNPVNPPPQFNRLGYGILNLGPSPVSGGKIVFTSNRFAFEPTKSFTNPAMQLFVMDADGSNVTAIAPMTLGSALHPTQLRDGRILFSSYESQGLRDSRAWGLWAIWPDGRNWQPVVSAFKWANAFHFATQITGDDLIVCDYYNLNNFGFGALYRLPTLPATDEPGFYPAFLSQNPPIEQTLVLGGRAQIWPRFMSFTPRGLHSITRLTNAEDAASPLVEGRYRGKFTQPSAAPNGDTLVTWSPGPVNLLSRPSSLPAVDAGIYLIPGSRNIDHVDQLREVRNDPNYNEVWPRAVVSYHRLHGVVEPRQLPWLPNDGSEHSSLPAGTPYGLIGSSSFYKRESFPGNPGVRAGDIYDGLDAFNTRENDANSNWFTQGSDAGKYTNAEIWGVRIVAMEPNTHRSYGPNEGQHFFNHANERMRILGEIPLRKFDAQGQPVLDPEGNPDTSFLARIPADTPFTFQMIDARGAILTAAQTWHQVRPGEVRTDCGGCHSHSQRPLEFAKTAAGRPGYKLWDLVNQTPWLQRDSAGHASVRFVPRTGETVEFLRDIRPILQRSCVPCHTARNPTPPGNLVLDNYQLYPARQYSTILAPGDYMRLANDPGARWGHAPVIGRSAGWRQTNVSRYVRAFQSRRSLLIWKLYGARLDGWRNEDHPTERVPGEAATLPAGSNSNLADLDYTGEIMPPRDSHIAPLTEEEKLTFVRWIELGCPIQTGQGNATAYGWFLDDLRPTLTVSQPRPGSNVGPLDRIRIAAADAYTGIDPNSWSVRASVALAGRMPHSELSDLLTPIGGGIHELRLTTPLTGIRDAHLFAEVADRQGNVTRVDLRFDVLPR